MKDATKEEKTAVKVLGNIKNVGRCLIVFKKVSMTIRDLLIYIRSSWRLLRNCITEILKK